MVSYNQSIVSSTACGGPIRSGALTSDIRALNVGALKGVSYVLPVRPESRATLAERQRSAPSSAVPHPGVSVLWYPSVGMA